MESPFARYGLFRNPFGELTTSQRAELALVDTPRYLQWLQRSQRAVLQFIGPCGHGKSTHLRALQYAWAALQTQTELPALVYFPEDGTQPALPRSRPLWIDEAQRMSWWRRWQLRRQPGPLILGTHRDLSRELQATGFEVLTIDLDQPMPASRLRELLNRRILASSNSSTALTQSRAFGLAVDSDSAACSETILAQWDSEGLGSIVQSLLLTEAQVVVLQERFGSNIRLIEQHLYEQFQNFALKGEPWRPVA